MAQKRKVIYVDSCRERSRGSAVGSCPYMRCFSPNQDGETRGCSYKYGTLPRDGFPDWCPLEDAKA